MVFENHNAGERVRGRDRARAHRVDLRATGLTCDSRERARTRATGSSVQEWTATATHAGGKVVSWDGVDIFPFAGDKIARKDVYSNASRRVAEQLEENT